MTTAETKKKFNISYQKLANWREGTTNKRLNRRGKMVVYFYPKKLFEKIHYYWKKGKIEYTADGIKEIEKLIKEQEY